jgi:hypothetical protein
MSEAINMHKRIAMGGESEANHLKKGGKVKKYAAGGAVMSEKGVANLPAKGSAPPPLARPAIGEAGKIATLKKGGKAPTKKGIDLTIAVAVPMRKASGRGR